MVKRKENTAQKDAGIGTKDTAGRAPLSAPSPTLLMTASSTSRKGAAPARGVASDIERYASSGEQVKDVLDKGGVNTFMKMILLMLLKLRN